MTNVTPTIAMGHPRSNVATFIEGRQLAQRGHAARAQGFAYVVSGIGALIGAAALLPTMLVIEPMIVYPGAPVVAAFLGAVFIAILSRGAMAKGLAAGLLGVLLSTVGPDPFTETYRYSFGPPLPWGGLFIGITAGLFALPEMLDLTMTKRALAPPGAASNVSEALKGARMALKMAPLIVRHSALGVIGSVMPGSAGIVSWFSYAAGIALSKDKSRFGKGSYEGLLFSESALSAHDAGQAFPTLAFGIPGGTAWVFVLVAMLSYGVAPGRMLTSRADILVLIVISLALGNAALAVVGLLASGQLAKLGRAPYPLFGAVFIPATLLAAYLFTDDWLGGAIVLGFAVIGMLMKFFRWPRPPMMLGFFLGSFIEGNLAFAEAPLGLFETLTSPIPVLSLLLSITAAALFAFLAVKRRTTIAPSPRLPRPHRRPASYTGRGRSCSPSD